MKKRITIVPKGNKKALCYAALAILTKSQAEKLSNESLLKQFDNMAIDMAIEWAIEMSGDYEILVISRTTFSNVEEEMLKDIEKTAREFLSNVDKLELPKVLKEPECPSHESEEEEMTNKQFVEKLLHDLELPKENADHVIGAQILCIGSKSLPFPLPWGKLGYDTLQEMCQLYLAAHEND